MTAAARIAGLGIHLPERVRTTAETERMLRSSTRLPLPTGLIARMTGVETVHVADGMDASDLAAEAARTALRESPGDVDLVIFAAASQDLVEPATSHILSAKLGLDGVPVMDVKNACNSMLNGIQVAEALIRSGQYDRVLVAGGEKPSSAVRWHIRSRDEFLRSFPGFTMSDGGSAVVLERTDDPDRGILAQSFRADSHHWSIGTLPGGGTMHPRDVEATYFDMDGNALRDAFMALGPEPVHRFLAENAWTWDDIDFIALHQVSAPFLPPVFDALDVPIDRSIVTVADHGNLASATLPLQVQLARQRGIVGPGSLLLLIGLAGGISLGLTAVRL